MGKIMNIQYITESEFNHIEPTRQIIVHDNPQKFAIIDLGKPLGIYGINWRSDLIEPIIQLSSEQDTLWIGVDQKIVAINLNKGYICLSLSLITPLYQILIKNELTAILAEQEVLLVSANESLKCFEFLPDLASEISLLGDDFLIKMFDDSAWILTSTGLIKEANLLLV
jgi:hypothetical protein